MDWIDVLRWTNAMGALVVLVWLLGIITMVKDRLDTAQRSGAHALIFASACIAFGSAVQLSIEAPFNPAAFIATVYILALLRHLLIVTRSNRDMWQLRDPA